MVTPAWMRSAAPDLTKTWHVSTYSGPAIQVVSLEMSPHKAIGSLEGTVHLISLRRRCRVGKVSAGAPISRLWALPADAAATHPRLCRAALACAGRTVTILATVVLAAPMLSPPVPSPPAQSPPYPALTARVVTAARRVASAVVAAAIAIAAAIVATGALSDVALIAVAAAAVAALAAAAVAAAACPSRHRPSCRPRRGRLEPRGLGCGGGGSHTESQ